MTLELSPTERTIFAQLEARELEAAAITSLRAYGDALLGYLISQLRDEPQAREVFSMFAEDLWQALPTLTLRTTMRAYCYALARHAMHRYRDRDLRKQRRAVPLSAALSQAVAATRTQTAAFARSDNQQRIATLRERLHEEERALLTLRIDRALSWAEVAEALEQPPEGELAATVVRCRKRFQLIKQKLSRWAREEGIVPTGGV